MRRLAWIAIVSSLAACSVLTDPDELGYVEANVGDDCEDDEECGKDGICPWFYTDSQLVQTTSQCYIACSPEDPMNCDGTEFPFCFNYPDDAICLDRISLTGSFSCRVIGPSEGNNLVLTIGTDENAVKVPLTDCEIFGDTGALNVTFMFVGVAGDWWYDVLLQADNLDLESLKLGQLTHVRGLARKSKIEDPGGAAWYDESFVTGFFPQQELQQDPPLRRNFEITNIGNNIRGKITFDGFIYDAELDVSLF